MSVCGDCPTLAGSYLPPPGKVQFPFGPRWVVFCLLSSQWRSETSDKQTHCDSQTDSQPGIRGDFT